MKYHIDLRHKYRDIVKNLDTKVSINRLEYQKHEDVLYLTNKDVIHLSSDSYTHSRLKEYNDKELRHIIKKYRGDIEIKLDDLKELRALEDILIHIEK